MFIAVFFRFTQIYMIILTFNNNISIHKKFKRFQL
jgi:hypothetical protein